MDRYKLNNWINLANTGDYKLTRRKKKSLFLGYLNSDHDHYPQSYNYLCPNFNSTKEPRVR